MTSSPPDYSNSWQTTYVPGVASAAAGYLVSEYADPSPHPLTLPMSCLQGQTLYNDYRGSFDGVCVKGPTWDRVDYETLDYYTGEPVTSLTQSLLPSGGGPTELYVSYADYPVSAIIDGTILDGHRLSLHAADANPKNLVTFY